MEDTKNKNEEAVKHCRNWKGAKIFREVSYERKRVSI